MSPHLIPHRFPRLAYILFGGMLGILIIATGNASLANRAPTMVPRKLAPPGRMMELTTPWTGLWC